MSDEEKKALNSIKRKFECEQTRDNYKILIGLYKNVEIEILLNLIENQSKEIEDLKDFNIKLQATKDRLDSYDKENTLEIEKLKKEIKELKDRNKELIKQHAIEITDVDGNSIRIDLDGKIHNVYKIEEEQNNVK